MTSAETAQLQDLIRREARSLLQYVHESYPWARAQEQGLAAAVRELAEAEAEVVARLARWLARQRAPVALPGAYPMSFTTLNFVAVRFVLPRLLDDARRRLAEVERLHQRLPEGEGRELLGQWRDCLRRQIERLTQLQQPPAMAG